MKTELILITLLAIAGTALFFSESQTTELQATSADKNIFQIYTQWKKAHNKNTNGSEDKLRFTQFRENFQFAEAHNAKGQGVKLGMTLFADLSLEEYKQFALSKITATTKLQTSEVLEVSSAAPDQFSWVTKGAVNPIQNQGNCGSCWAFSAVSQLEGLDAISNGTLQKFSEQQVTSCSPLSFGCNGGNSLLAFYYTASAGIELESSYPYVQLNNPKTAACNYQESEVVWHNKSGKSVPSNNPKSMQAQLLTQPLSIAVDAGNVYFQLYSSGILNNESCGTQLDHAISIVGYDLTGSVDYWVVRNSWGTTWGEQGYINMGIANGDGICGMNMDVTYPTD